MGSSETEWRRLRWRCRRGLLENDLVLERFLRCYQHRLDEMAMKRLNRLLEYDDNTLWDLLSGRTQCSDVQMQGLVALIRAA